MTMSKLTEEHLFDAAAALRRASTHSVPIEPLRLELPSGTLDDAYHIQGMNTAVALSQGRRLVGRKIGLTSSAVQRQLGVDQPDYGMLFADMELVDASCVDISYLIEPKMEVELAFVMEHDITQPQCSMSQILRSIAFALPAIEIVDSRIASWDIGIFDTVADNASAGLYVLGATPVPISAIDMRLAGMVLEVDGEPLSTGATAACMGNPLVALRWLAHKMIELDRPLLAGDTVLSGALGPLVHVLPGQSVCARIHGVGDVRISFEYPGVQEDRKGGAS